MNTRNTRSMAAIALAALMSGCAGGGAAQHDLLPANGPSTQGAASVALSVIIPQRATSSGQRSTLHLPSSSKSMAVTVNGGTAQIVGLQPTDPGCSVSGGNTVCNAKVLAPIGSDTFDLTAYDAAGATGNKLSHATSVKTVVAGTNNFPIVLGGIVASVALSTASVIYEGAATSTAVGNVAAKDADGNLIVGAYDRAVVIAGSGTFAGTSGTLAKSGDTIALNYNGTDPANVGSTTFTATAGSTSIALTAGTIVQNPLNLASANVALWYDAADAATIVSSSTSFTWKDRSANAKDASSSQAPLPTYPDTSVPGTSHAFVAFTAGTPASAGPPAVPATPGAFLSRADGFPGGDYSIFAVTYDMQANASGSGNPGAIIGGGIGTNPSGHGMLLTAPGTLCLYEANSNCTGVQASIAATPTTFKNTLMRVTGIDSANTGTIAINGATTAPAFATGTLPARVVDPSVVINGYNNDGLTSGPNRIAEIIVLDHAATASEQSAIEAYLKAKWSLTQ